MEFKRDGSRFYSEKDGKVIAEVTWKTIDEATADINHTYVDPSLRGQGIAEQLVDAAAEEIEKENKKILPSCPYVAELFDRKKEKYKHVRPE